MVACAAMLLAGCSALPSSGPTVSDVRDNVSEDDVVNYMLVDVDARALDELKSRSTVGLYDSFGNDMSTGAPDLRIGVGDAVSVAIWEVGGGLFTPAAMAIPDAGAVGAASGTGSGTATIPPQIVPRDGAITIPFAGRVHVAGLTPAQAENAIRNALAGKAMEPQVLVTISSNVSGTVTVMGEVTGGARVPLSISGDHLLDVIASAGGIKTPVAETTIRLTRGGRTARAALSSILTNPGENVYVRPGDVITVERETRAFVALGASGANAQVPFDRADLNLAQAIGKAGGLQDSRADAEGVFVFRYEPAEVARALDPRNPLPELGQPVPVVYRLDLRNPKGYFFAQRFAVHEDDVIFVSNSPLNELQKVLSLFSTVTTPLFTGAAIYNTTKN